MSILTTLDPCPRCGHKPIGRVTGSWGDYGLEKQYASMICPYCKLESDMVPFDGEITPYIKHICVEVWNDLIEEYHMKLIV